VYVVYVRGKSDGSIVPTKRSNKTGTPAAEISASVVVVLAGINSIIEGPAD
jgi:hypothetical protein